MILDLSEIPVNKQITEDGYQSSRDFRTALKEFCDMQCYDDYYTHVTITKAQAKSLLK